LLWFYKNRKGKIIMRQQNNVEGTVVTDPESLELTGEMTDRNDEIDNAVYDCILTLAEKSDNELPWDTEIIADVTEAIKEVLAEHCIRVRHPAVVTESNGNQHYESYEYPKDGTECLIVVYKDDSRLTITNEKAGVVREYYKRGIGDLSSVKSAVIQKYPKKANPLILLAGDGAGKKIPMSSMDIYQNRGYKDRDDYLRQLAAEHCVAAEMVFAAADLLGPNEDFDGLVTTIEDDMM
jgi:hypothetical protein